MEVLLLSNVMSMFYAPGLSLIYEFLQYILFQDSGMSVYCGEEPLYVWGSIWPVYSPTSRRIYKNSICASCHNVQDGISWTPVIDCSGNTEKPHEGSLNILLENFNFNEAGCRLHFLYNGDTSDIIHLKCFSQLIAECSVETNYYYMRSNKTIAELKSACENEFISPVFLFDQWYRNVFCVYCHGFGISRCLTGSFGTRTFEHTLLTVLDMTTVNKLSTWKDNVKRREPKMACRYLHNVSNNTAVHMIIVCDIILII